MSADAELAHSAADTAEVQRILELLCRPFEAPADPADARPPPLPWLEMPPLDASRLGPRGARVVEALEDADYWRRLCPELTVNDAAGQSSALAKEGRFAFSAERCAAFRRGLCSDSTSIDQAWEGAVTSRPLDGDGCATSCRAAAREPARLPWRAASARMGALRARPPPCGPFPFHSDFGRDAKERTPRLRIRVYVEYIPH